MLSSVLYVTKIVSRIDGGITMSNDKNKNVNNAKKQVCGRHTFLADVSKKATEAAKKKNIKITIE